MLRTRCTYQSHRMNACPVVQPTPTKPLPAAITAPLTITPATNGEWTPPLRPIRAAMLLKARTAAPCMHCMQCEGIVCCASSEPARHSPPLVRAGLDHVGWGRLQYLASQRI